VQSLHESDAFFSDPEDATTRLIQNTGYHLTKLNSIKLDYTLPQWPQI